MKTINSLMKHMRDKGIKISGSRQKRSLINYGYFHSYKGYRVNAQRRPIGFHSFDELEKVILFDSAIKEAIFGKLTFIETAVRNIVLHNSMEEIHGHSLSLFFDKAIVGFSNCGPDLDQFKRARIQQRKNKLRSVLVSEVVKAYDQKNPKVTHYYESGHHDSVPLWAVFEICMMGNLDFIMESLVFPLRRRINESLSLNYSFDTDQRTASAMIHSLRFLRNAVAHNEIVYDARFTKQDPPKILKRCLRQELGITDPTFRKITDYIALISILLRKLGVSKTTVRQFINTIKKQYGELQSALPTPLFHEILPYNWETELGQISENL